VKWLFRNRLSGGLWRIELRDLFYTVIFLEELKKIKSSGSVAAMGAFLFSHDAFERRR
jgi:hypothetical protein